MVNQNDWSRDKPNHSEIIDRLTTKGTEELFKERKTIKSGISRDDELVEKPSSDNVTRQKLSKEPLGSLDDLMSQEDHLSERGDVWLPQKGESARENSNPLTGLFTVDTPKESQNANTWLDDNAKVESKTSIKNVIKNKFKVKDENGLLEDQPVQYANLIERFFAFVIDAALPYLFFYLIVLLSTPVSAGRTIVANVLFIVYLAFFIDLVPSLGRKLMNITISYDKEKYDNYKRHYESHWRTRKQSPESVRSIARVLTLPILPISVIYSLFNENGMMFHDLPLGCKTVKNPDTIVTVFIRAFTILIIVALPIIF